MYKLELCNKCKATNVNSLLPKIRNISDDIEIIIHCIQYCGIGRDRIVVLLDHIPIIGDTEEEVIEKIVNKINK